MANAMTLTAQPPYSEEAEQGVLGAVLINGDAYYTCAALITAQSFYLLRNQYVWEAMARICERAEPIDSLTVCNELRAMGRLSDIGGAAYITHLINAASSSAYPEVYARLVQRAAVRRKMLMAADEIKALAMDEETNLEAVIAEANERLFKATDQQLAEKSSHIGAVAQGYMNHLEAMYLGEKKMGVPTGINAIDKATGGLFKREVTLIAAPSGVGKTSLLTSIALNAARQKIRTVIFTVEMTEHEIVQRWFSMETGIPTERLKSGNVSDIEFNMTVEALKRIGALPVYVIDDCIPLTPLSLNRRLRKLIREHGIDLVLIDGLWLMQGDANYKGDRSKENADIMARVARMSKELNVSVLMTHQMNRAAFDRRDHRPTPRDLDYGGDRDANNIWALYRESAFDPDGRTETSLHVIKARDGATPVIELGFSKAHSQYR